MLPCLPTPPDIAVITASNPGPMTLEGTNTYLVGREPTTVIDPGPEDRAHIDNVVTAAFDRGGWDGVLLTHGHADHAAGVTMLLERWQAMTDARRESLADLDETEGVSRAVLRQTGLPNEVHADQAEMLADLTRHPPDFSDESGPELQTLRTPGHSEDHVCFLIPPHGEIGHSFDGWICFSGDLILGEGSTIVPPEAQGGSLADYMDSLRKLQGLEIELIYPGHGPVITDPAAKIAEYIAHREEREAKLIAALESGERSRVALLDRVWDDVPAELRPAAAYAMQAHVEKLDAEGRLREEELSE